MLTLIIGLIIILTVIIGLTTGLYSTLVYWSARRMFENDPELQAQEKRIQESIAKANRMAEEYCDKYGCIEPDENTIKLETFAEMRRKKRNI